MGLGDKIANEVKEKVGQAKEAVGDALDNPDLEAAGEREQREAAVRKAGHAAHDKVDDVADAARDKIDDVKRKLD
jgi:uncharacterized protein YjbJ (UPF0337 family)